MSEQRIICRGERCDVKSNLIMRDLFKKGRLQVGILGKIIIIIYYD